MSEHGCLSTFAVMCGVSREERRARHMAELPDYSAATACTCPCHAASTPDRAALDDDLIDRFAVALKAKMAEARAKGRGGWENPEWLHEDIVRRMRAHMAKGDPRDVAVFCAFLWHRGWGTVLPEVVVLAEPPGPRAAPADVTG